MFANKTGADGVALSYACELGSVGSTRSRGRKEKSNRGLMISMCARCQVMDENN